MIRGGGGRGGEGVRERGGSTGSEDAGAPRTHVMVLSTALMPRETQRVIGVLFPTQQGNFEF